MTTSRNRPYRHYGVLLPSEDVEEQWIVNPRINRRGFIYVNSLKQNLVFCVQSVLTGQLLVNKIIPPNKYQQDSPEELRISTAPIAVRRLPPPRRVNGAERLYFNELVHWQRLENDTYSLYFKYYNGGSLEDMIERYHREGRPVPEHFVWHVAERLFEAVAYFNFGIRPGTNIEVPNWDLISHRDLEDNNIFIHYHPRAPGRAPAIGRESRAFPEIVIGDFGLAHSASDDPTKIEGSSINQTVVTSWEDMVCIQSVTQKYTVGATLRTLCQAHIPNDGTVDLPNDCPMSTVNGHLAANERPYSDDLIRLLERFEILPDDNGEYEIMYSIPDDNGNPIYNYERMPSAREVVDTILPQIRRKVRRWRGPGTKPRGYFNNLDISWTAPERVMPYEYNYPPPPLPGDNPGDNDEEGDDNDDDDEEDNQGNGTQGNDNQEDEEEEAREEETSGNGDDDYSSYVEEHRCPTPEIDRNRRRMETITCWETIRPAHRIVNLEFPYPIVLPVLNPPPAPYPDPPEDGDSSPEDNGDSGDEDDEDDNDGPPKKKRRIGN